MSTTKMTGKSFLILAFCTLLVAGALSLVPAATYEKACPTGWYFAEGYTGGSFDTWILIQNPFAVDTTAELRFFTPDGDPIPWTVDIAGETRTSIYLNSIPGLEGGAEVATEVRVAGSGIICERAMYFDYESGIGDRAGGHSSIGSAGTSCSWYLPEGYTGGDFDTFVLLMNPNAEDANVTLKLMKPGEGKYYPFKLVVPAGKRRTVKLDDLVWTEGADNIIAAEVEPPADPVQVAFDSTDVSTWVYCSNVGIVAERAMYFDYYGKEGGSNSIGATGAAPVWYLPEGYTGGDFDTWVMAMNPNSYPVDITYTFYSNQEGFEPVSVVHENVPKYSRDTINVDTVPGLEGTDVSTKVSATRPVTLYESAAAEDPVERYALLYGVDDYATGDDLLYAVDDVYDLKHQLYDQGGFEYDYRVNSGECGATTTNLAADMANLASKVDSNDLVFFYFAGRSTAADSIDLYDAPVDLTTLESYFAALGTDNLVAMFDCDNGGDIAEGLSDTGRILVGSCGTGEARHEYLHEGFTAATTSDWVGNGAFTYFFIEALEMKAADADDNGLVSAEEAFAYADGLATQVVVDQEEPDESQVPEIYDGDPLNDLDLTVTDVPVGIVAERSCYFNYGDANDGATSIGAPRTCSNWFLAEGYTGGGFDTYILVMNPYDNWQKLTVTYMTPGGEPIVCEYDCPPLYRLTIPVDAIPELADSDVSARVYAEYMDPPEGYGASYYPAGNSGVAVERAMYFTYTDPGDGSEKTGGTCSIGFGE